MPSSPALLAIRDVGILPVPSVDVVAKMLYELIAIVSHSQRPLAPATLLSDWILTCLEQVRPGNLSEVKEYVPQSPPSR